MSNRQIKDFMTADPGAARLSGSRPRRSPGY
jgi:hypothetical protein